MSKRYSIAEARHNLAAIIHELEEQALIELTRRGEPVAVLLSTDVYRQLTGATSSFWSAYQTFRTGLTHADLTDVADSFSDLRDTSPGRQISL